MNIITYMLTSTQAPAALGAGAGTAGTLHKLGPPKISIESWLFSRDP